LNFSINDVKSKKRRQIWAADVARLERPRKRQRRKNNRLEVAGCGF
jgi:hypothetical protein